MKLQVLQQVAVTCVAICILAAVGCCASQKGEDQKAFGRAETSAIWGQLDKVFLDNMDAQENYDDVANEETAYGMFCSQYTVYII